MRHTAIFMASGDLVSFASTALAAGYACEYGWKPGDRLPGVIGNVNFMFPLDPDGDGPAKPLLMLEGSFYVRLSRTELDHDFVGWDGKRMVNSVPSPGLAGAIWAWIEFQGDVYIGGYSLGDDHHQGVLRWNGVAWEPPGGGLDGDVGTFLDYNGKLYAGGNFWDESTGDYSGFAVLQDDEWIHLADQQRQHQPWIDGLAVYQDEIIAVGDLQWDINGELEYLARWNGETWVEFAGGANAWVGDVAVQGDQLFIAGNFTQVGDVAARGFAKWDGHSWSPFEYAGFPFVNGFAEYQGRLVANGSTGWRGSSSSTPSGFKAVEQWNGENWIPVGGGFARAGVASVAEIDGKLFAGGSVGPDGTGVKMFDGTNWRYLTNGLNDEVLALGIHQGKLLMGGYFSAAGGQDCAGLALWDGASPSCHPSAMSARSMVTFRDNLFIENSNGLFELMNGEWIPRFEQTTESLQLLVIDEGLVLGGRFNSVGGVNARNIALWDGAAWSPLGDGLEWEVRELEAFAGGIVAYVASGSPPYSYRVMYWDGAQWAGMGDGLSKCCVYDFTIFDGNLLAAGNLGTIGGVEDVAIALWNGWDWEPFERGAPSEPGMKVAYLSELDVYQGRLYAAGTFMDGPVETRDIVAQWAQGRWLPLGAGAGSGAYGPGHALQVFGNDLVIGGLLTFAGDELSAYWARWGPLGTCGDFDGDGALERSDFELWYECASPPIRLTDAAETSADCLCIFNTDGDGDVDLADFARLQNALRVGEN